MRGWIKHFGAPGNIPLVLHHFSFVELLVLCFLLGLKQNSWTNFLRPTPIWTTQWFSWLKGSRNLESNSIKALSVQELVPNKSQAPNKVLKTCSLLSVPLLIWSITYCIFLPSLLNFFMFQVEVDDTSTCEKWMISMLSCVSRALRSLLSSPVAVW